MVNYQLSMFDILNEIWTLLCEMSPYLLLGFLLAGLMHEFVPGTVYTKHLGDRSLRSVVLAALFGVPLPLCSCGVIPTAMGIRKEGASKGATISFLIATPQTGVDSIIATYSLMGLPFAIIRPVAALFTALFGGWMVNRFAHEDEQHSAEAVHKEESEAGCCCHSHEHEHEHHHEHHHEHDEDDDDDGCHCGCHHEEIDESTFWGKFKGSMRYAFVEMLQDVGKWLVIGLLIAALITVAVPNEWLAALHNYKLLNMLIVLAISIPMYICATGSIPIAVSLLAKGLTPGAALVMLMAGPAVNSASLLVIGKVFGKRTLWLYLLSIVIGAVLFGLGIDYLLPASWFEVGNAVNSGAGCAHCLSVWDWLFLGVFILLLINAFLQQWHHSYQIKKNHQKSIEMKDENNQNETIHTQYKIEGMSCNHCKANVEKCISQIPGVESVNVDLAKGIAYVEGQHDPQTLMRAISDIGFIASPAV